MQRNLKEINLLSLSIKLNLIIRKMQNNIIFSSFHLSNY